MGRRVSAERHGCGEHAQRPRRARLDLPVVGVPVLLACTAAVFANSRTDAVGTGGDIFATTNWAWATFGWQAMLLLWRWPLRWLLCALGVNMALCLATAYATGPLDRVSLSRMVLVFWGTASIQVAVASGQGRWYGWQSARRGRALSGQSYWRPGRRRKGCMQTGSAATAGSGRRYVSCSPAWPPLSSTRPKRGYSSDAP